MAGLKQLGNINSALCVDLHEDPGGSWNDFYSNVRLHTSYRMFGVNGYPWHLNDPTVLAPRLDVLHHFGSYVKNEFPSGFHFQGKTEFESLSNDGTFTVKLKTSEGTELIEADHVIDARGFNYKGHMTKEDDPLTAKDSQEETEMKDLPGIFEQAAPTDGRCIVIIGGGLTGVDAALYATKYRNANDEILLITGSSKFFWNRDYLKQPISWSTKTLGEQFLGLGLMFNGNNGLECLQALEQGGLLHRLVDAPAYGFLGAFMSGEQKSVVNHNCEIIANDHFVRCDGRSVYLKSGRVIEKQKQIVVVNCRSSMQLRENVFSRDLPPIAKNGVLCPGTHLGGTGATAYLYTLLYGLGKLEDTKQWGIPERTGRKVDAQWSVGWGLKIIANILAVMDNLPFKLKTTFKLKGDSVFPIPRQILTFAKFQRHKKSIFENADKHLLPLHSRPN